MQKAINQWCFPPDVDWLTVFRVCKANSFTGFELCIDPNGFFEEITRSSRADVVADIARSVGAQLRATRSLSFDSSDNQIRTAADIAADHEVSFVSLTSFAQFHYSLTSLDDRLWREALQLTERLVEIAVLVGSPSVLVIPGVVAEDCPYDAAHDRLMEALTILVPYASERGVRLGLENVWNRFLQSPMELRSLVDRFDAASLGVHFDVGNVMQFGYPDQWIRMLGGRRLVNVHLKDFVLGIGNIRGFTHLFQGDVPWARTMAALRDIDFHGALIAEVPPYSFCPQEGIRDISRKIDILCSLAEGTDHVSWD